MFNDIATLHGNPVDIHGMVATDKVGSGPQNGRNGAAKGNCIGNVDLVPQPALYPLLVGSKIVTGSFTMYLLTFGFSIIRF